jgi:hypothetical protein
MYVVLINKSSARQRLMVFGWQEIRQAYTEAAA